MTSTTVQTTTPTETTDTSSIDTTTRAIPTVHLRGANHTQRIAKVLATKTFCTLATVSPSGFPHSAGVVVEWADGALWFHTMRSSRKARNIDMESRVAVTIPYRRLPVGPPFTLHFQATAEVIDMTDPAARRLIDAGRLKAIVGHGALDEPRCLRPNHARRHDSQLRARRTNARPDSRPAAPRHRVEPRR